MGHPPRIPVWLRWEQSVIYFVTICVADRKRVLANEAAFKAFKNAPAKFRRWRVLAAIRSEVFAASESRINFRAQVFRTKRRAQLPAVDEERWSILHTTRDALLSLPKNARFDFVAIRIFGEPLHIQTEGASICSEELS